MNKKTLTQKDEKIPNPNKIIYPNLNNPDLFIDSLAKAYKNKTIDDEYIFSLSNLLNKNTYAKLLKLILDKDKPVLLSKKKKANLNKQPRSATKYRKKNIRTKTNFYMSITREQIVKILELSYEKDKIMGMFYYLQYMTGARCSEIANIKMQDISKIKVEDEYMYRINIYVAKKRNETIIRPVLVSLLDFAKIQDAHKEYAQANIKNRISMYNYNYLKRTYLFQKTKYKRLSTNNMSFFLRQIIQKVTRKKNIGKCSHIFRHYRIFLMKNSNIPSYDIKEEFHFSNINMVDRYGKPLIDKKKDYEFMINEKPSFAR
ncbi:tyrosine-type recombinase/integrase (plasmid) [Borrelia sp. A-FGy1]|uniref:tyrosine-type recombinase/integrase n=1 Tax=Borrelia sp. A-FGy1 TaxID=2608247 RepID=UPI0015F67B16|nr:tyrosine-type recombinase/integrase [Borrelia sp. A-FGy1]QMU99827.1 tyrosine-type recombinase/integrase [Borrelia sp. A-FGy1]